MEEDILEVFPMGVDYIKFREKSCMEFRFQNMDVKLVRINEPLYIIEY
jgi:hypothetical protein